jgi:superfamily II DNA/RNA helicase
VEAARKLSFRDAGLSDELLEAASSLRATVTRARSPTLAAQVDALGLLSPTEVQAQVIPEVLKGSSHLVMASHTGSGKTLAFLLPVARALLAHFVVLDAHERAQVQKLRAEESATGLRTRAKRPRVVVLEPTRELAQQVLGVAKSLCHYARFSSALLCGNEKCGCGQPAATASLLTLAAGCSCSASCSPRRATCSLAPPGG